MYCSNVLFTTNLHCKKVNVENKTQTIEVFLPQFHVLFNVLLDHFKCNQVFWVDIIISNFPILDFYGYFPDFSII